MPERTVPVTERQRVALTALLRRAHEAQAALSAYASAIVEGTDTPAGGPILDLTDAGLVVAVPDPPPAVPAS